MRILALSIRTLSTVALVAAMCATAAAKNPPGTAKYPADVAIQWADLLYDRIKADGVSPPAAARIYGLAGVVLYEAVQPGMSKTNATLQGQLNGLAANTLPKINKKKAYHWPTVANTALHDVLVSLMASSSASVTAFDGLRDTLETGFQAAIPDTTFARSQNRGALVAAQLITWIAGDGFTTQSGCPAYVVGSDPSDWQPTAPAFSTTPLLPCWGDIRTLALTNSQEIQVATPITFSTSNTSLFYAQGLEVLASKPTGGSEEAAIANFWADGPTATGTPPGHWIDTVRQIAIAQDVNLAEAATAWARVGIGVHDAFIACWEFKYQYDIMRPITYIQSSAAIDGAWTPLLTTPNFPEYPSGHSTQSGAAVIQMEDAFGFAYAYTDTLHTDQNSGLGFPDRSFLSFDQAGREAAVSRLYGGIHFRAGNEYGYELGQAIGRLIRDEIEFRKGEDDS